MRLFHIIASAQGNRAFLNMGQAFGFSDELMAQTVRYFVPPIAKAIEKKAQTADGLLSVLEFLGSRRYDRFLDDPRIFGHEQVQQEGERILRYLFVQDSRVNKIVENRAKVLPLDASILKKLFPFIAVMVIGGVEIRTRRPLGVILHRLGNGLTDARSIANPYLALAQHLRTQEREQRDQRRRRFFAFLGGASRQPAPAASEPAHSTAAIFQSA